MATPDPQLIPGEQLEPLAQLAADPIAGAVRAALADFNCETPGCTNAYRFVSLFVGDSQAHYHCPPCWLAWNQAIAKGLLEQGLLELPDTEPDAAGA